MQLTTALTLRRHVLPEERMVDVATTVELDGTLQLNLLAKVTVLLGLGESLVRSVQVVDVGLMVLRVVKRHDLGSNEWLESIVSLRKRRKSHVSCQS